ncbi:uncharacterized protein LOC142220380 [Haematobia irritans]|uniref:uncharacterized protein LOC142220380 n=1 Tax=Haematobia irritans TaxID=7368 RepID=UPI003F50A8F2
MAGMCRLCASLKPSLTKITSSSDENAEKILFCCRLHILDSGPLPKTICQECIEKLDKTYQFLKQIQDSQKNLRAFFDIEAEENEDDIGPGPSFTVADVPSSTSKRRKTREYIISECLNVKQEDDDPLADLQRRYIQSEDDQDDSMDVSDESSSMEASRNTRSSGRRNQSKTLKESNTVSSHCRCNELVSRMKAMKAQMKILIDNSKEHKYMLSKHFTRDTLEIRSQFPIQTSQKLEEINESINEDNKAEYLKILRSLLHPAGVGKNLRYVLNAKVTLQYNIDGVHGKKGLKHLENFYSVLLAAIPNPPNHIGPAEDQLRKAINLQKKREFKTICVMRNKNVKKELNEVRRYNFQAKKVICTPIEEDTVGSNSEQ